MKARLPRFHWTENRLAFIYFGMNTIYFYISAVMLSLIKIFPLIHEIFPIIYYSRNRFFIEADNKTQERQNWDYFAMYQVPSFFIQNIDINHFLAVTRKNFKIDLEISLKIVSKIKFWATFKTTKKIGFLPELSFLCFV